MTPPKAKLHSKTGRLKNINKTYTSTTNSSNSMNRTSTSRTISQVSGTNQNEIATPTSTEPSTSNNLRDTPATEQFELELCWCIQTLEKSIESGKLNEKQGKKKINFVN